MRREEDRDRRLEMWSGRWHGWFEGVRLKVRRPTASSSVVVGIAMSKKTCLLVFVS